MWTMYPVAIGQKFTRHLRGRFIPLKAANFYLNAFICCLTATIVTRSVLSWKYNMYQWRRTDATIHEGRWWSGDLFSAIYGFHRATSKAVTYIVQLDGLRIVFSSVSADLHVTQRNVYALGGMHESALVDLFLPKKDKLLLDNDKCWNPPDWPVTVL